MVFGKSFGKSALFEPIEHGIEPSLIATAVNIPVAHAGTGIDQNNDTGTADKMFPLRMKIIKEQTPQGGNPQGEQNSTLPPLEFDGIDFVSANEVTKEQRENDKRQKPVAIALDSSPSKNCLRNVGARHRGVLYQNNGKPGTPYSYTLPLLHNSAIPPCVSFANVS